MRPPCQAKGLAGVSEQEPSSVVQDEWKRKAAECAACYVESGMVVGLGSGSTAAYALRRLGHLLRTGRLEGIAGVPTSRRTELLACKQGIPLITLQECLDVDVTIDGADEVDPDLNLIKGRGGAMLREKIVARASRCVIIVVDEGKLVPRLGVQAPLPVEVVPFGWPLAFRELGALGMRPALRMADGDPVVTDEGNYVLDCQIATPEDPRELSQAVRAIPGVVEHGLFVELASLVIVAGRDGLQLLWARETGDGDARCYRYEMGHGH